MQRSFLVTDLQRYSVSVVEEIAQLQSHWPIDIALSSDDQDSVFSAYPLLFIDAFPTLTPSAISPLAVAGRLVFNALLISDALSDGKISSDMTAIALLRIQALQYESERLLQGLFPPTSSFWSHWQAYLLEYTQACLLERRYASGACPWGDYTEAIAYQVAMGKSALAKGAIAGMASLADDEHLVLALTASIDHYAVARQLFDDLQDWKEDIQHKQPSLPLAMVADFCPIGRDGVVSSEDIAMIGRHLYYEGHVSGVLGMALTALDQADQVIADLPPLMWHMMIVDLREKCCSLRHDIDRIVQENLQQAQRCVSESCPPRTQRSRWRLPSWQALSILLSRWKQRIGARYHPVLIPHDKDQRG